MTILRLQLCTNHKGINIMKRLFAVFGLIGLIGCDSTIYSTDAFAEPRIEARDSYCHFSYDPADADVELKVGDCHTYVDTRQGSGTVYAHARFTNTFHPLYGMEYLNEHAH
ncbi:MAG: hypothetical protein KJO69_02845, partial [Gammaproteobacteria bacterium]|nr:hypothetical protein [Gammaproteobacteria bacterium]